MLSETKHEDVIRLHFETRSSRAIRFAVSVYVIRDVLIDTAFPHVAHELSAWLDGHTVRGAILTHYHEDHAGNIGVLAARGIPTWIATATLPLLVRPARIGLYRRLCWGSTPPLTAVPPPFTDASLTAIPTPGHAVDHHIVWDASTGTVFGADLFLGVKVRVAHPPARENIRQQIHSLRQIIALAPDRYFDAHRGPVSNPLTMLGSKLAWMEETVGQIDALIADGISDEQISHRILGRREIIDFVSAGDYSRRNFVRSVRASSPGRTS